MGIQQTLPTFTNRKTYSVIIFRLGLLYYTTYITYIYIPDILGAILRDFPVDFQSTKDDVLRGGCGLRSVETSNG